MAENPAVNYSAPVSRLRLTRNGTVEFFRDSKIAAKEGSILDLVLPGPSFIHPSILTGDVTLEIRMLSVIIPFNVSLLLF